MKKTDDSNVDCVSKIIPLVNCLHTYQGEGPNCGKRMVLTRFKYCNLCCPFCDTQMIMKEATPTMYSLYDLNNMLLKSPNLMITGGEPTLTKTIGNDQFSQFVLTVMMIRNLKYRFVDIETNGYSIIPLLDQVNEYIDSSYTKKKINISWSPKFIHEDDFESNLEKLKNVLNEGYVYVIPILKIVIGDDLDQYKNFVYQAVECGYDPNRIYLMPKGTTLDEINHSMELVKKVANDVSCNISSRLHIIHDFA